MKRIKLRVTHYTKPNELVKVNNYLDSCAKTGHLRGIRQDKNKDGTQTLHFANYKDNSMYLMKLNKSGFIEKITKW